MSKPFQFGLAYFLMTSVVLAFILSVAIRQWASLRIGFVDAVRFLVISGAAIAGRQFTAVRMPTNFGSVGKKSVTWFATVIAVSIAVCALHAVHRPNHWQRDFGGGVALLSLLIGIGVATALELLITVFLCFCALREDRSEADKRGRSK